MKKIILIALMLLSIGSTMAQVKVGNNPTVINPNSALEIESTNKGVLMPRVALTATNSAAPLSAFVPGMIVYNTAAAGTAPNNVTPGVYYCDGSKWQKIVNATTDQTVDVTGLATGLSSPNAFTGGSFSPNTPANSDVIYVNKADGSTWTYNGSQYVRYQTPASTPWFLAGGTTDAGSNKNSSVYRNGAVAIGATAPDPSAKLDVASTTQGLLVPRMTTFQKQEIAGPADGLIVYDTDLACYSLYSTGRWNCLGQDLTSTVGTITNLDCANVITNGQLYSPAPASGTYFIVGYTGSNGGFFDAQNVASTGVTGLTAKLLAGSFNKTSGSVTYYVTGTPASSGTASFNISLGGQSCTINLNVLPASGTASLNCAGATVNGTALSATLPASGQTITLPYTTGNGGPYNSATFVSSQPTLSALLSAGSFANGAGNLTLTLSGTPSAAGTATVAITVGGSSCTVNIPVSALSPCTTPTAPTSSHSPATFVAAAAANTGGNVGSFSAAGGSYTSLGWSLTSLPATGVLSGATSGTGTSATVNVVPGARGRVIITWSAFNTGSCITTTTTVTDTLVIGDAILYGMQTGGCTNCAAYDAAPANNWVQVTASEYNQVATVVTGASKRAATDVQMNAGVQHWAGANYTFFNYSAADLPANNFMIGFSAIYSSVATSDVKRVKTSTLSTSGYADLGGNALPINNAVGTTVRVYWILKRPSSVYTGTFLGHYSGGVGLFGHRFGGEVGWVGGDLSFATEGGFYTALMQAVTTATNQW